MRILSGIQPTGQLHLGNYLGALRNFVALQNTHECFFMVADLHALTVMHSPNEFRGAIRETMRAFLAAGLSPRACVLFVQSRVPQHAELSWILETLTPLGELQRMTQFKEKSQQGQEQINSGLLTYPVLQAADILLYKPQAVPVGEDQLQHLELARALARKFNRVFGKVFMEPKAMLVKQGNRVMSLQDPTKKMSKSLGPQHSIGLFEQENSIRQKIQGAVTDSGHEIIFDLAAKPAIANLLTIYSLISGDSIPRIEKRYAKKGYAEFKQNLAEIIITHLKPIRERYRAIKDSEIDRAFSAGTKKAQKEAEATMKIVRQKIGLID